MDYNMDKRENERLMCRNLLPNNNSLILQNSTRQMTGTHQEVRMTGDGEDGNGLQYGTYLKTFGSHLSNLVQLPLKLQQQKSVAT